MRTWNAFHAILVLILLALVDTTLALNNNTLLSPLTDHGDPNLICIPAKWTDIIVFYLGNYVAHAATVKTIPGQSALSGIFSTITALLFPNCGLDRGLEAIFSFAILAKTDLQMAARAGALVMVVKEAQEPQPDGIELVETNSSAGSVESEVTPPNTLSPVETPTQTPVDEEKGTSAQVTTYSSVHGRCSLPPRYIIVPVARRAVFESDPTQTDFDPVVKISCNYNIVKVLVALGQAVYAITTLYQTRGDQIARFGYAAFGLTVTPYAFMSTVNLVGNLMCPDYSHKYLVESEGLRQLREECQDSTPHCVRDLERNVFVEGVVGKLLTNEEPKRWGISEKLSSRISPPFFLVSAVSLAIVGGLSRFQKGSSSVAQRVWTMAWLAFGLSVGFPEAMDDSFWGFDKFNTQILMAVCSAPAIGGFVVVGQMLHEYGVCYQI